MHRLTWTVAAWAAVSAAALAAPPAEETVQGLYEGIRKDAERTFTVPALTRIEEFNSTFGTRFSDEEFDTIGGLVLHELGRMPRRGEAIQIGGLELKVVRADRRRIETLRVTTPRDVDLKPAGAD